MKTRNHHVVYLPDDKELVLYMDALLDKGCEETGEMYACEPVNHRGEILYEYVFSENMYLAVQKYLEGRA